MRGVHCRADPTKQCEALTDRKLVPFAVFVDRHAIHILHHEVGDTVVGRSAVEQPGNVAVIESRQNLSFGFQTIVICAGHESGSDELDRNLLLVIVAALGEVDVAHPAATQPPQESPGPQLLPATVDRPFVVEIIRGAKPVVPQNALQRARVVGAGGLEVVRPLSGP